MKKLVAITIMLFIGANFSVAQKLDEILETHFEFIGQDKLNEVNTIKFEGVALNQGQEFPFSLLFKRPDKMRIEINIQGQKMIQAYDGEKAWGIIPFSGTTDPQEFGADQTRGMKMNSDIDGAIYNYSEKGYTAELIGEEDVEGTPAYRIELANEDGDQLIYFIDLENNVLLKQITKMIIQGQEVAPETYYSNYQQIDGIVFPMENETKMNGYVVRHAKIDTVLMNVDIDDDVFIMPETNKKESDTEPEEEPEK